MGKFMDWLMDDESETIFESYCDQERGISVTRLKVSTMKNNQKVTKVIEFPKFLLETFARKDEKRQIEYK